jgi:hypothetical protein
MRVSESHYGRSRSAHSFNGAAVSWAGHDCGGCGQGAVWSRSRHNNHAAADGEGVGRRLDYGHGRGGRHNDRPCVSRRVVDDERRPIRGRRAAIGHSRGRGAAIGHP